MSNFDKNTTFMCGIKKDTVKSSFSLFVSTFKMTA